MLKLEKIKRSDTRMAQNMAIHYSQPKGFVGRNLCYAILWDDICYGTIAGGSATLHLPGRNEYFGISKLNLNNIINNIFYHIEKINNVYPKRNFTECVLSNFCDIVSKDWTEKYHDEVMGFESLVELPRTGELYLRSGWDCVGTTIGYTCKRPGMSYQDEKTRKDNYGGHRVWNTDKESLRPKLVFCKKI